jgi:hypothetical protein
MAYRAHLHPKLTVVRVEALGEGSGGSKEKLMLKASARPSSLSSQVVGELVVISNTRRKA